MGILNVTPDSFSDGGRFQSPEEAVHAGVIMVNEGADLIDVGGESTRPGATPVDESEEIERVVPVINGLVAKGISVSIDTMKPAVARAALDAGAFLVNDVSGLRSPEMLVLVQERKPYVCIMHMQGNPATMQKHPTYGDVVAEVHDYLLEQASQIDLPTKQIWLDPGIGFGKNLDHNLALINGLSELGAAGYPVLIGVSRKGFLGKIANPNGDPLPVEERLEATLAAQVWAQLQGVSVIRTHDVRAARRAIEATAAIQNGSPKV